MINQNIRYIPVAIVLLLFVSCGKKDRIDVAVAPAEGTRLELSLDSLYLYAKEIYLWYDALPDYSSFGPRKYAGAGGGIEPLQNELKAITSLAVNPQTGLSYEFRQGYDRPVYSFIAEGNIITGRQASVNIEGKGNDMGLGLAIVKGNEVYVNYVEDGSPAAQAGIARGMQVLAIDGINVPLNSNIVAELLSGERMGITLKKKDGDSFHVILEKKSYNASPVFKSAVLTEGNEKTGYTALARFSNLGAGKARLDEVFEQFANENIKDVIVDLRYNNGGYVETAQYIADLIAPPALDGKVMYAEHFNDLLQKEKAPILKTIPYIGEDGKQVQINGRPATYADVDFSVAGNTYRFSKKGLLTDVRSIVFIVTGMTASASELLINSFKPYLDVKLVGSRTYGKPVGNFGIGIDIFTAYLSNFRILNAENQGDYYDGIPVDITAQDDVTKDFGDPREDGVSKALQSMNERRAGVGGRDEKAGEVKYVFGAGFDRQENMISNGVRLKKH